MKNNLVVFAAIGLAGIFLTGCAGNMACKDYTWYGASGAQQPPVKDTVMNGQWWMPDKAPEGMSDKQWGNRGYVFVANCPPAPVVKMEEKQPAPPEKVVEKTAIQEKIVEKPVEKIVYVDKPVEKIVEKIKYVFLNLKDVYFWWDSAKIEPPNTHVLKDNADVLKNHPDVKVLLVGSASPEGTRMHNEKLSESRVNAVKDYLVNQEGIAAERLETKAIGPVPVEEKKSYPFERKVSFVPLE